VCALQETEIGPGEDLALLAGHLMLDAYRRGGDVGYVVAGAAILESCLQGSKYNFQAKVLLIQFYQLLGMTASLPSASPFVLFLTDVDVGARRV
jgi:hypothetical protein